MRVKMKVCFICGLALLLSGNYVHSAIIRERRAVTTDEPPELEDLPPGQTNGTAADPGEEEEAAEVESPSLTLTSSGGGNSTNSSTAEQPQSGTEEEASEADELLPDGNAANIDPYIDTAATTTESPYYYYDTQPRYVYSSPWWSNLFFNRNLWYYFLS